MFFFHSKITLLKNIDIQENIDFLCANVSCPIGLFSNTLAFMDVRYVRKLRI